MRDYFEGQIFALLYAEIFLILKPVRGVCGMRCGRVLNKRVLWAVAFCLILPCGCSTFKAATMPATLKLSEVRLNTPDSKEAGQYLGVGGQRSFALSEIHAKLIVLGYYGVKCPFCHEQAPVSNKIYAGIRQDPELDQNVKMIGVMIGSNPDETKAYADSFNIPYPMTNDPFFEIYRQLGKTNVPLTLVMTKDGVILLHKTGVIADPDGFVKKIKEFNLSQ